MSRAIAVARPSIESAAVVGQLPTRQSRKPRKPKLIDVPRQSKALPRRRPSSIVAPLGRLVSSRLTRRSHPDCRAIVAVERVEVGGDYPFIHSWHGLLDVPAHEPRLRDLSLRRKDDAAPRQ